MKKKILYISSIVLASLLVGVFWLLRVDKEEKVDKTTVIKKEKRDSSLKSDEKVRRIIKGRVAESRKGEKKKVKGTIGEEFSHLSPTDRKLAEDVQLALDESDFESVVTAAKAALMSSNTEVRENAVEALGWFGAKALPELTLAMADKDADIAETAMQHWQQALSELNDESLQAQASAAGWAIM